MTGSSCCLSSSCFDSEESERVIDETFEETERDEAVIVLDSCKLLLICFLASVLFLTLVCVDNSDLHFKVNGTSGSGISKHSLCYLWSGARATHGITKGKHFFECKVMSTHELRRGIIYLDALISAVYYY